MLTLGFNSDWNLVSQHSCTTKLLVGISHRPIPYVSKYPDA